MKKWKLSLVIMVCLMIRSARGRQSPDVTPVYQGSSSTMEATLNAPVNPVPYGTKPKVYLVVKNLRDRVVEVPDGVVHVEGVKGEPPTTLLQRQYAHQLRKGEQDLPLDGYRPDIEPGATFTATCDLSQFYNLSPGTYTVYVIVEHPWSGTQHQGGKVKTNTVQLTILPDSA